MFPPGERTGYGRTPFHRDDPQIDPISKAILMAEGRIIGAIPARYASTRLPGKPLRSIAGKPMIEHVVRRVEQVPGLDRVVGLTDDPRIFDAVRDFGGEVEMTPEDCPSGTDRIAYAARNWDCEAVINIQGDEPLIDPSSVGLLVDLFTRRTDVEMATLSAPLELERHEDPNTVKVVTRLDGDALYFSRAPIPYPRNAFSESSVENSPSGPRLHIGIYGYRKDVLLRLASLEPTPLERLESLEQLRALENGISIHVLSLDRPAHPGVDTPEDLERVASFLQSQTPSFDPTDSDSGS